MTIIILISFQTVSRRHEGSFQRNLIIGLTQDLTTTLLCPTSIVTSTRPLPKPKSYAQTIKATIFMPRPPITEYQTKAILEDVVIESKFDRPSVQEFCSQIFLHGFNFFSEDIKKTRQFYEFILVDTISTKITHILDKNS